MKVLLEKISRTEKRRHELKSKQDEENQLKYNKVYMSMEEKRARVARNEKIREYQRAQQLKQIEERMKRIEEMKIEREKVEPVTVPYTKLEQKLAEINGLEDVYKQNII